jgi:hypothetical protein
VIVRTRSRLRLALPWLEAALEAAVAEGASTARVPAIEWLVARGRTSPVSRAEWRQWLLATTDAGSGLLRSCPAGPSVRALRKGGRPEGTWACARPAHLMTAIDHLQLAAGSVNLDAGEASVLLDDVNSHLDGRGFRFHAAGPADDWQLECVEPVDCSSVEPEDAAGRSVRDLMPGGRDGARVCSLINELQMLLHEHPVNRERVARRLPAVNSLWLWGFGRLGAAGTARLPTLCTDDAWLAGIWRLHGAAGRPLEQYTVAEPLADDDALLAWSRSPAGSPGEILAAAERRCFAPALDALRSGTVGGVDILLGARAFKVDSGARFRFWRRPKPLTEVLA